MNLVVKTIMTPEAKIQIYQDMTIEIRELDTYELLKINSLQSKAIHDALDPLVKQTVRATIDGVNYGLRDFPSGEPGLWFSSSFGNGHGSFHTLEGDVLKSFLIDNSIHNIKDLEGRACFVKEHENGYVEFLGLV